MSLKPRPTRPRHKLRPKPRPRLFVRAALPLPQSSQVRAQWTPQQMTLEELLLDYPLPQIVRCRTPVLQHRSQNGHIMLPVQLDRLMVLADKRTARHLLARIVSFDGRTRTFNESADSVVIPEDYEGRFLRLQSRTTKDKTHVQSLENIAQDDTPAFLNLSNITSFPARRHGPADRSRLIYTVGNVFLVDEPLPAEQKEQAAPKPRSQVNSTSSEKSQTGHTAGQSASFVNSPAAPKAQSNVNSASSANSPAAPGTQSQVNSASSVDSPPAQSQVNSASSVNSPQVNAASSVNSPQVNSASSVRSPQINSASSVNSPQVSSASSVNSPQVNSASSVNSPQVNSASSVRSPQINSASSIKSSPGPKAQSQVNSANPVNSRPKSATNDSSGHGSSQSWMRCLDERGLAIMVPTNQPGEMVVVQKNGAQQGNRLSVKSSDMIANEQFPLLARYAYGKRQPRLTSFSKLFTLLDSFQETTIIACTITGTTVMLMEIPLTSSLQFQVALNREELLKVPKLRRAVDACRTRGVDLARDIKFKWKFQHRVQDTSRRLQKMKGKEGEEGDADIPASAADIERPRVVLSDAYVYI